MSIQKQTSITSPFIAKNFSHLGASCNNSVNGDAQDAQQLKLRDRALSSDQSPIYRSSMQSRQPINSPAPEQKHKDYNRYKYYDKLRTGFISHIASNQSQLAEERPDACCSSHHVADFLRPPSHVIDQQLFVLRIPFAKDQTPGQKQGSLVIIFSYWKTMIGSAVVSLPWAFQQSGLLLGCIISFCSFFVSYYTCNLIVHCARKDTDFSDTVRRYYGAFGYYLGSVMSATLLYGVLIVYFVIQTQLLYPLTLAVYAWSSGSNPVFLSEPTLSQYSQSYCALVLFFSLSLICSKKDLSIFMKVGSIGVIFVFMLIIFIIWTGGVAFTNTEFMLGTPGQANDTDWSSSLRTLTLSNPNFSPLAGILGLGYFLHPCSIPIVRSAAKPENTKRDMFLGYFFVFISYVIIGTLGSIGFVGTDFTAYFESKVGTSTAGQIDQNCLNMFAYTDAAAFVLRSAIFLLIFSGYPLVHFFLYSIMLKLIFGDKEQKRITELLFGWSIIFVNLLFALFYPNIGTVLSYVGAICGFVIIYFLPVLVYLAQSKEEVYLTLRGQMDQSITSLPKPTGPNFRLKIHPTEYTSETTSKDDNFVSQNFSQSAGSSLTGHSDLEERLWHNHKLRTFAHCLIPVYGLGVLIAQFA